MRKYRCTVCNYIYDEAKEGKPFSELPDNWRCPVCNAMRDAFILLIGESREEKKEIKTVSDILIEQMAEWGIQYVFGIPGTSSLGLIEAIRKNGRLNCRVLLLSPVSYRAF